MPQELTWQEKIPKMKSDLSTYIAADYSITWAIAKVYTDYRVWRYDPVLNGQNAWLQNFVDTCKLLKGAKLIYI